MLATILGWISGYVVLQISGENKERFLNLALQKGADVYDVTWLNEDVMEAKADYKQLGLLRKIGRATHCRFKIRRKKGLPFCYRYLKQRKMLAIGFVLFCAGIFVLSNVVLEVEVSPQEKIVTLNLDEVQQKAEALGVRPGAFVKRLDLTQIEKDLKNQISALSWVEIERQGTRLKVLVAERQIYPEEEEQATIGAIWANRDALIEEVLIKHGQAMVAAGDTVTAGQLLVSPLADGRADAFINARVWYDGYGECPLREEVTKTVGQEKKTFFLLGKDGEKTLLLWGRPDTPVQKMQGQGESQLIVGSEEYQPRLLPFVLREDSICPQMVLYRDNTEAAAKAKALKQAQSSLEQQIGKNNQLLQEQADYHLNENGIWCAKIRWECKEEIGMRNRTE